MYILQFNYSIDLERYIIIGKDVEIEKQIKTVINSFDDMTFVRTVKNINKALGLIFKNTPDIIFLGIDSYIDKLPEFLLDIAKLSTPTRFYRNFFFQRICIRCLQI